MNNLIVFTREKLKNYKFQFDNLKKTQFSPKNQLNIPESSFIKKSFGYVEFNRLHRYAICFRECVAWGRLTVMGVVRHRE